MLGFLSVWDLSLPLGQPRRVSELKWIKTIEKFGVKVCKKLRVFAEMDQGCTHPSTLSPAWPQARGREHTGDTTNSARNHQVKAQTEWGFQMLQD